jgi:histidinol-phosphate/aromatic aminotransferase/cobyric acid decarboxylase-like protein
VFDPAANFVLVRLADPAAARSMIDTLRRAEILVKDVGHLPKLTACVRFGVGTTGELDLVEATLDAWLRARG